jgi:DNA mismatch repair protein MutS
MQFEVDNQTLHDLAIFSNGSNQKSIFNLFDKAITIGGREKFRSIFYSPLTDAAEIQSRVDVFAYFQSVNVNFDIDKTTLDFIEFYLE